MIKKNSYSSSIFFFYSSSIIYLSLIDYISTKPYKPKHFRISRSLASGDLRFSLISGR